MYVDTSERLISSDNPSVIEWMVLDALKKGEDLSGQPFVFRGHFCQFVVERVTLYEYKLLSALTPGDFDDELRRMKSQGFERSFEPVNWDGLLCQWMARPKAQALTNTETLAGFKLVAGVQVLGGLSSLNFLPGVIR